jgi:hypothetical protein
MRSVIVSLLLALRVTLRDRAAMQLEILALRHQLHVINRSRPQRLPLTYADRMLWVSLSKNAGTDGGQLSSSSDPRRSSPGTVSASGSSGHGRADTAWVDRACLRTSAS